MKNMSQTIHALDLAIVVKDSNCFKFLVKPSCTDSGLVVQTKTIYSVGLTCSREWKKIFVVNTFFNTF